MSGAIAKAVVFVLLPLVMGAALAEEPPADPEQIIREAKARALEIPLQVEALIRLAWFDQDFGPEVAARAREELVLLSDHALPGLRTALRKVKPEQQAEVVDAIIRGRPVMATGSAPQYLPAIDDAIWFGSREARRLAVPEAARLGYRPSLLPMIDAALEDPELLPLTVQSLGTLRDDRARFFLEEQLLGGDEQIRGLAAGSLAKLGGRAKGPPHSAMQSESREVRLAAVRALIPIATVEDLSALFEYYGSHPDDDPATLEEVKDTALRLELLFQQDQELESPTPNPDQ